MAAVLEELGLSRLADIPALTAVGAAAILAEAGDPRRYDSSSSLVKHAGMSPSDNASGAFYGEAHISRRGRPGLRLTVWRAVWPMLRFNPVMAAKYQAMTQAADDRRAGRRSAVRRGIAAGQRGGRRRPRAARQGPRRVRRLLAALDLLHGRPRHQLGSCHRPAGPASCRRRQPDQRFHPAPAKRVPETFLPDEGESEPVPASGTNPVRHPGQLSPGRPELLTSSVERCRSRPARTHRGRAEPACTT